MLQPPKVLLLICDEAEKGILQEILSPYAEMTSVCDTREMEEVLNASSYDVLFCAWSLCSGGWNEALEEVRQRHPYLPVIILSRTADERRWLQVLEAGAFDLLAPPYYERAVLSVLEHAVASHDARMWQHAGRLKENVG